jgi:hypothetical protein
MSAGVQGSTLICTTSGRHHLLARRSLTPDSKGELELAFFTCPPARQHARGTGVRGRRPVGQAITITGHDYRALSGQPANPERG